jgi:uncharacterized protein
MKVALRELPTSRSIAIGNALIREAIADLPLRVALERPDNDPSAGAGHAELELYAESDNVFARGALTGWLEVACSRCVGPVRVPVDEALTVTFMPIAKLPADDDADAAYIGGALSRDADGDDGDSYDGFSLTADDLDVYPYEGDAVDLEPLLREQFILAVPFAPLCREDCKGLCPQCGGDRNLAACACQPPLDPRLAALRDIEL